MAGLSNSMMFIDNISSDPHRVSFSFISEQDNEPSGKFISGSHPKSGLFHTTDRPSVGGISHGAICF